MGLAVAPSRLPGSGLGLFTLVARKKKERVVEYLGRAYVPGAADAPKCGAYVVQLSGKAAIDGADPHSAGYGRFVNCCRTANQQAGHARGNNLSFAVDHRRQRVQMVTTRAVDAGEELFVPYGPSYGWRKFAAPSAVNGAGEEEEEENGRE